MQLRLREIAKLIAGCLSLAGFAVMVFWLSGTFRWQRAWGCIGIMVVLHGMSGLYLWRKDPELIKRRGSIGQGTKTWDKAVVALFGLVHLAVWIIAALDHRHAWSNMPDYMWIAGGALYFAFVIVLTQTMSVNPHFEKSVRIQHERGHRVIDSGPYRYLRHPGYAVGILGFVLGVPLLLGSWYAFLPAALSAAILVVRTALEDRTLCNELPGYLEYTERVRYRLVPGIW